MGMIQSDDRIMKAISSSVVCSLLLFAFTTASSSSGDGTGISSSSCTDGSTTTTTTASLFFADAKGFSFRFPSRRQRSDPNSAQGPAPPSSSTTTSSRSDHHLHAPGADAPSPATSTTRSSRHSHSSGKDIGGGGDGGGGDAAGGGDNDPFQSIFLPTSLSLPSTLLIQQLSQRFLSLLLYKPPVGIVTVYTVTRLILSGRIFQMYPEPKAIEDILHKEASKTEGQKHQGRALYLDKDDQKYFKYGGIDPVRRRLCLAALAESENPRAITLIEALTKGTRPGGTRSQFLLDSVSSLSLLERQQGQFKDTIELLAYTTIQTRAMDALLRVVRDRQLRASYRLARSMEYWKRRISRDGWKQQSTQDGDRIRLSYAEAAYRAELQRLGRIAKILMIRPPEMEEKYLIQALKDTELKDHTLEKQRNHVSWSLPRLSKYSIRWNPYGKKSPISVRKLEDSTIDSKSAQGIIMSDETRDDWVKSATNWSEDARKLVCEIIHETLDGSSSTEEYNEVDFQSIAKEWGSISYGPDTNVVLMWTKALMYAQNIARFRRVGEGTVLRLRDVLDVDWPRKLNVFGIPRVLLYIGAAYIIHGQIVPYWPQAKTEFLRVFWKTLEVVESRVWVPFKGIWDDLMNKEPGLMSGFTLDIEQASLDHMLRDMGFGDGTESTRLRALQMAAEKYETDLKNGPLKSMIGGSLVRELLIQVQQLKVGVLTALETIDVLLRGNRIHFQILAAIPAVLIATFGTRLFLRFFYNIRTRDLRPVTAVHGEMADYLNRSEGIFLLCREERSGNALSDLELGEFLLHMHRYLMLMDFTSPPFPHWLCEQIHAALREFLGVDGIIAPSLVTASDVSSQSRTMEQRLAWLNSVQKKHQELLKHL